MKLHVLTDDVNSCGDKDNDALICKEIYPRYFHGETWLKCVVFYKLSADKFDERSIENTNSHFCRMIQRYFCYFDAIKRVSPKGYKSCLVFHSNFGVSCLIRNV